MLSYKFLATLIFSVVVASCGGGGGSAGTTPGTIAPPAPVVRPLFTSATAEVTLAPGAVGAQTFAVGGGTAPYIATSSNAALVSVLLAGNTLKLTGLSAGSANVLIIDSTGATSNIAVVVPPTNGLPLFTTSPSSISVAVGEKPTYSLGGGTAPYSVASSNAGVASASVVGSILTVTGNSAGNASLVVRDNVAGIVVVAVNVPIPSSSALFTTAPPAITVAIGAAPGYSVGGGVGPYSAVTSNASVAIVSLSGGNLTVTGVATGSANIVVRDSSGALLTIPVTVPAIGSLALFTTAPPNVTVGIGAAPVYSVGGGTGPYSAVTSNASVATAVIREGNLTVIGVAAGAANVLVRDSTGTLVTINVLVGATPLAVTPNGATGIISDTLVATITGGTPPFRASVGNTLVASAQISTATLTITLRQVGQTVVTVLDANNQSIAYSVTVNAATPGIRLSPGAVTISETSKENVLFQVFGASAASAGGVQVFSSDLSKLTATVDNATGIITLNTASPNNRCVDTDTAVTITVVDSSRATGVATVTIKDNSPAACP